MRRSGPLPPRRFSDAAPVAVVFLILAVAGILLFWAAQSAAAETVTRDLGTRTVKVKSPRMPTGTAAKSAAVMDAETGRLLWTMKPDQRRLIASTTKIMTALVAISRTRPNEMLTATAYRAGVGESLLGLKPGERMSAQDLLKALLLESANDAADTFAARTATSRAAFVDAMNRRARSLGLSDTLYGNPIGLDVPRTYSTAGDLAKLTRAALEEPRFANVVDKAKATLRTGSQVRVIHNRNDLVGRYSYVSGVKTGHTTAAGYLLVGAADKVDAQVISVVTGEPSIARRNDDTLKLLRFGRKFYTPVAPLVTRSAVYSLPVALQDIKAPVYPTKNVRFAARNGERVSVALTAADELEGPIAAGTRVGTATVTRNGQVVAKSPVVVKKAVPEPPIAAVMLHTLGRLLPLIALLAIVLLIGVLVLRRRRERPRRPEFVG